MPEFRSRPPAAPAANMSTRAARPAVSARAPPPGRMAKRATAAAPRRPPAAHPGSRGRARSAPPDVNSRRLAGRAKSLRRCQGAHHSVRMAPFNALGDEGLLRFAPQWRASRRRGLRPGPAPESADLCGPEHRDRKICLARGACVHWAPPNAASFLTARACRLASAEFGWTAFFAYSDPMAGRDRHGLSGGELDLSRRGRGAAKGRDRLRFFSRREGRWLSERVLRKLGSISPNCGPVPNGSQA